MTRHEKVLLTADRCRCGLSSSRARAHAQTYPIEADHARRAVRGRRADRHASRASSPSGCDASLGQTVVVENTTGAAGTIGVGKVVRAAPDGYTVLIGHWSTHVINGAIYPLTYDLLNDFAPISLIASNPQLLVDQEGRAGEGPQGTDRLGEGQPGQGFRRHRAASARGVAFQRRLFPERDRHQVHLRAVSRHRPGAAGRGRGQSRSDLRPGGERAAAGAERQCAGVRRDRQNAARPRRPTFPRWTRRACRASTSRSGMRSGCRRARRRTS